MELPDNPALLLIDVQIAINRPKRAHATTRRPKRTSPGCWRLARRQSAGLPREGQRAFPGLRLPPIQTGQRHPALRAASFGRAAHREVDPQRLRRNRSRGAPSSGGICTLVIVGFCHQPLCRVDRAHDGRSRFQGLHRFRCDGNPRPDRAKRRASTPIWCMPSRSRACTASSSPWSIPRRFSRP